MNGSAQCPHVEMHFNFHMTRFVDSNLRYLEIKGLCKTCNIEITFRGLPMGLNPHHPTATVGRTSVILPFMLGDEIYDGKSKGFSVKRKK